MPAPVVGSVARMAEGDRQQASSSGWVAAASSARSVSWSCQSSWGWEPARTVRSSWGGIEGRRPRVGRSSVCRGADRCQRASASTSGVWRGRRLLFSPSAPDGERLAASVRAGGVEQRVARRHTARARPLPGRVGTSSSRRQATEGLCRDVIGVGRVASSSGERQDGAMVGGEEGPKRSSRGVMVSCRSMSDPVPGVAVTRGGPRRGGARRPQVVMSRSGGTPKRVARAAP